MNKTGLKRENQEFFWYALNVNNGNMDDLIEKIKGLGTQRIDKIINLSNVILSSKVKTRTIFIRLALTNKLKNAILGLEGVRHFLPNNYVPYIFADIDDFLKYHVDKKELPEVKQKYLHKHEINEVDSIIHSVNKNNKLNNIDMKYKIGDTIIINHGIFQDHVGVITEIKDDLVYIDIQINNSKTNISTSIHVSDTELIKHSNE